MKNQTKIAAAKNKQNAHTPTTDKGQRERKTGERVEATEGMWHMEIGSKARGKRGSAGAGHALNKYVYFKLLSHVKRRL